MGEIADAMIDGTLCAMCGTFIGDGDGIPAYCSRQCAVGAGAAKPRSDRPKGTIDGTWLEIAQYVRGRAISREQARKDLGIGRKGLNRVLNAMRAANIVWIKGPDFGLTTKGLAQLAKTEEKP